MSVKARKTTVFSIFMIISILAFPRHIKAQDKPVYKNRIFSANQFLHENRPPHRTHPYGGTLVMGARNIPTIINPILTTHTVSADLTSIIFNTLVRVNSTGEIEPNLAENWQISTDGLMYTFYLKRGIKFHDGIECTAEDVQFTYRQLIDSQNNSPYRFHFELIQEIEVLNKYALRIILSKPFPPLLFKLADREIVPKHILEGEDLQKTSFNYHPIGSGPFKFKSWDRETNQIELVANPDYFEGRPYLDKIIVKIYPDSSHLWSAIMRQEIDLILYLNDEDYQIIKKDPAFKTYKISWDKYWAIAYNLNDAILHDQEIRRAIAFGINRKKIMEKISISGIESTGPFHPKSIGFNPGVKPLEYNPVKAKMNLMHRGWHDVDGDGILEKNKVDLEIRLLVNESSKIYKKMAVLIRQQLAEIGIKTKIIFYKDENVLNKGFLERNRPQAWLRFFKGFGLDPYEAAGSWYSVSTEFCKAWDYKNEEIDRLFKSGRVIKDENARAELYKNIHKIIYDEQPACFLFFPSISHAVSAKIEETNEFFNTYMPVYTMKDWYISDN